MFRAVDVSRVLTTTYKHKRASSSVSTAVAHDTFLSLSLSLFRPLSLALEVELLYSAYYMYYAHGCHLQLQCFNHTYCRGTPWLLPPGVSRACFFSIVDRRVRRVFLDPTICPARASACLCFAITPSMSFPYGHPEQPSNERVSCCCQPVDVLPGDHARGGRDRQASPARRQLHPRQDVRGRV